MTLIKVCGICDAASAAAAVEAGADLLGFHFCSSPRRVTRAEAHAIVDSLPGRRPEIVGVFIDQSPAEVAEIAEQVGLDRVQLHGSEPPGFDAPRPPIKVLKVRDGVIPDAEPWPDPVLVDSWSSDQRGGTGRAWDWELARPLLASRRVIVAGGLNPENVRELVERYRPYGVDVSSGVESRPRVKDPALVRAFVAAVRQADAR
jgi:phosphoribosylanthranilate isomerase